MDQAILLCFGLGLPIVACLLIWFGKRLLMDVIPKIDPQVDKTRTDIFSIRASYACFVLGIVILAVWALGVTVLGVMAGIRLL